jgi:SynChlorMet cassette protein ScmC
MRDMHDVVGLSLANGISLGFAPGDKLASLFISRFASVMQLRSIANPTLNIILRIDGQEPYGIYESNSITEKEIKKKLLLWDCGYWKLFEGEIEKTAICVLNMEFADESFYEQLDYISGIIGYVALNKRGLIIHGGLAEKDNKGVIFSGKSGVGKTTTINRLADPWKPLCDEHTLIVRDDRGTHWAHPLPTRSRFNRNGSGGTWNSQYCVPLKGIFFLTQDSNDQIISLNINDAIYLINRCSSGAMAPIFEMAEPEKKKRALNQILEGSINLAQAIPVHILKLSLTGSFWNDVERAIDKRAIMDQENLKACHPVPTIHCSL